MFEGIRRFIPNNMPLIICLCGSTRFAAAFHEWNLRLTLEGHIILSIGADMKTDAEVFENMQAEQVETIKRQLDVLHLRKIELADRIMVLNDMVEGRPYIGDSTKREIEYARSLGKPIMWLNQDERINKHQKREWVYAQPVPGDWLMGLRFA